MCTASWWFGEGQSALCFNRDERKTRPRANPPEPFLNKGIRCLAPVDPQGGGTWLCVNERGLCAFILNNYEAGAATAGSKRKTRGGLVMEACSYSSRIAAASWIEAEELSEYAPFFLGLLDREGCEIRGWDGQELTRLRGSSDFLTTSSFRSGEVQSYRKSRYETWRRETADLGDLEDRLQYHLNVDNPDPAFNPLMRRVESETHNVSAMSLGSDAARFIYLERGRDKDAFEARRVSQLHFL